MTETSDTEKPSILATITSFLSSISNKPPPFPDAYSYILPESYAVLSHPASHDGDDGLIKCTLADFIARIESKRAASPPDISVEVSIASPGPDVWVGGRFAAVWTGVSLKINGAETRRGVAAYTLFKREEGWKIGAIADKQWHASDPAPGFINEVTPEMMEPSLELCRLLNEEKWDKVESLMLPGGGATYMRFPHTLIQVGWPDFFAKMRVMLEKAKPGYVEQALMDWDGRICGDVGLVWTPFTVALDGEVKIRGYNIFTMLKLDGKWFISGAQDG